MSVDGGLALAVYVALPRRRSNLPFLHDVMIKGSSSWACVEGFQRAREVKFETAAGSRGVAGIGEGR